MRALGLIQAALRAAPPGSLLLVAACQLQRAVPAEKLDRAEPTDSAQSAPASAPDSSTPSTDHTDRLFIETVLATPAALHRSRAESLLAEDCDAGRKNTMMHGGSGFLKQ